MRHSATAGSQAGAHDGDEQPAKFMRGAAGKARPCSSSPSVRFRDASGPGRAADSHFAACSLERRWEGDGRARAHPFGGARIPGHRGEGFGEALASVACGGTRPVKVVLLLVHDYITLECRTRDGADRAHRALEASAMQYHNVKGHSLEAVPIRCKSLAIRRHGKAMKEFYPIVDETCKGQGCFAEAWREGPRGRHDFPCGERCGWPGGLRGRPHCHVGGRWCRGGADGGPDAAGTEVQTPPGVPAKFATVVEALVV